MADKLTIQILGWNSAKDLPKALAALKTIPQADVVIRYIDNGSRDDSVRLVRQMLPGAEVVELGENLGFAGGHNAGFALCETELVMVHNPDLEVDWAGVKRVLDVFNDKKVAGAQGKLLRDARRQIIDSAGVELTLTLNGRDRGAGEVDRGQFEKAAKLDAVTGAAGIYRVKALRAVAHDGREIFDEDFFAYKEDVDLGWRLRRNGWQVKYVPVLMGRHGRALGPGTEHAWSFELRRARQRLKDKRTYLSLRNWVWMIVKNASFKQLLIHEIFIDARLLLFAAMSFLHPPFFKVWPEIWQGLPKMLAKRDGSFDRHR